MAQDDDARRALVAEQPCDAGVEGGGDPVEDQDGGDPRSPLDGGQHAPAHPRAPGERAER